MKNRMFISTLAFVALNYVSLVGAYVQPFLDLSGFAWAENLMITNNGFQNILVESFIVFIFLLIDPLI